MEDTPTNTFGYVTTLQMDGSDPGGTGKDKSGLLKWDLSVIPSGSKVTSASVAVNVTNSSPETYEAYALKRTWAEAAASWLVSTPSATPGRWSGPRDRSIGKRRWRAA